MTQAGFASAGSPGRNLNNELSRRIAEQFPAIDSQVSVRYASGNQLSVFGALKEDK
ncbi:DinI-like family protein, partial [Escherichia coli]|nr:DinI-like family protein [Escherichia coli]